MNKTIEEKFRKKKLRGTKKETLKNTEKKRTKMKKKKTLTLRTTKEYISEIIKRNFSVQ
jgi:hypothetical protein